MEVKEKLHFQANLFQLLFSLLTRKVVDVETGQHVYTFKENIKGEMKIMDVSEQVLLQTKREFKVGFSWDVYDHAKGNEHLVYVNNNVIKTTLRFGAEDWTIFGPDRTTEIMQFTRENDSRGKRLLDNFSDLLYNPEHAYVLKTGGAEVARIKARHGIWRTYYDFEIVKYQTTYF